MEDEAEEEDEGILSDVHVSPNAPITIQGDAEEGKQRDERDTAFVTRFTFRLPVCGQEIDNAETPGQEVGRILELDEQGDIVVSRRKPRRRIERVAAVTIVHSLSVPLSSVGLQVIRTNALPTSAQTLHTYFPYPPGVAGEFGVGGLCGCK